MRDLDMSNKEKVDIILKIFRGYQPALNIVEQIALLTIWVETCINREEYEIAGALTKEIKNIQKNPHLVPQRLEGKLDTKLLVEDNPLLVKRETWQVVDEDIITKIEKELPKKEKRSFFRKIVKWFKKIFKRRKR
jgi:hypothetical protein